MVSHQRGQRAAHRAWRRTRLIMAISSASTSFTSPTIGMSTFTRLEMLDGSMSMWMILRSFWREVLGVADHAVVEARAHGQQHVAVLHRVVGFDGAVHAQHAQELAVAGRDRRPGPSACW